MGIFWVWLDTCFLQGAFQGCFLVQTLESVGYMVGMKKRCPRCEKNRLVKSFGLDRSREDGLTAYCNSCRKTFRARTAAKPDFREKSNKRSKRIRDRNREYIHDLLKKSKCVDCGDTRWQVLEFDHLREKKNNVSSMMKNNSSIAKLQAEIDKCEIVCANCHRWRSLIRCGSSKIEREST
jgi:hypothetical protein